MHKPSRNQPVENRLLRIHRQQIVERDRRIADAGKKRLFRWLETLRHHIRHAGSDRKAAVMPTGMAGAQLFFQRRQNNLAMCHRGKAQRQKAARTEREPGLQATIIDMDFGIAAKPIGA